MNLEPSNTQTMLSPESLKSLLPGIITRVAINYPVAYINSLTFLVKNKIVVACYWNEKNAPEKNGVRFTLDIDNKNHYFIFYGTDDIQHGDIEITGTDEAGMEFIVMLPFQHLIRHRMAS